MRASMWTKSLTCAILYHSLHLGSSVTLHGTLQPSKGTSQSVELSVHDIRVTGTCDPEVYPIQNKPTPSSVLRDAQAHLRFRTSLIGSLMRFRDGLMRNWADWFEVRTYF
jgi:asparaginyl-tRNA synthetase